MSPKLKSVMIMFRVLRRPLGPAELLVEASFTDMRHGGDGNLSRAYELANRVSKFHFSLSTLRKQLASTAAYFRM
jgi:hypothetical protein